jgi:hypothetical protein
MFDEGTDHSPVELDGLGGNAGISTPYLPFGGNPPQQYPEYQQLGDESVMRINGQEVRATLDGVGIPFVFLLHLLQNGSALPAALDRYQHLQGFRFESNGSGTFSVNIPRQVGWNVTYNGQNDNQGTASAVYSGSNNYTFMFGAALSGFRQTKEDETKIDSRLPKNLKAGVVEISNRSNCKDALQALFLSLKNRKFGDYESLDLEVLFNRISSFEINPTLTPPNEFGMGATAPIVNGKRIVAYAIELPSPNSSVRFNQYIKVAIAELLHHARKKGVYRDDDLDKAAGDLMTKDNYNAQLKLMKDGNYRVGFIGHNYINKFCNYSEEEIKNGIPLAGN